MDGPTRASPNFSSNSMFCNAECCLLMTCDIAISCLQYFLCNRLPKDQFLPIDNDVPPSRSDAKPLLASMGMDYQRIHACQNDCVLFGNEYADLDKCPHCKSKRFREMCLEKQFLSRFCVTFLLYLKLGAYFGVSPLQS